MQQKFDWLIVLENLRRGIMATDVTELESLRLKERLMANANDADALSFFSVLDEWKSAGKKAR